MAIATLTGLAVALAVPVWLVVEEMLHRRKPAGRVERVPGALGTARAPGRGAEVRLGGDIA